MRIPFLSLCAIILAFGITACSKSNSKYAAHPLSDDFSARMVPDDWVSTVPPVAALLTRDQCQALLTKAICLTSASGDDISDDWQTVSCQPDNDPYVTIAMQLFDEMPQRLQPMFCSVNRLFISPNIVSTASATALYDHAGNVAGGYINFRQATFTNQPTAQDLVTWKEQLAFGGSSQFLSNNPQLVQMSYGLHMDHLAKDGLFYVLVHELGHLVDFNNGISACHTHGACKFGDWVSLAWTGTSTPIASTEFKYQPQFCFYNCGTKFVSPTLAGAIYGSLAASGFPTTYSGMNEYEDFAENWAWYIMRQFKEPNYVITVPGLGTFDMNSAFTTSPVIAQKQAFMNLLWNSPALKTTNGNQ